MYNVHLKTENYFTGRFFSESFQKPNAMQRCKAFEKEFHDYSEELARWCCVEKDLFHGGSLNGNVCHRLLRNTDILRFICPLSALKYAECFVFHHIVDFCEPRREGLARWSEKASESVHFDFEAYGADIQCKVNRTIPAYNNYLLKAVQTYV